MNLFGLSFLLYILKWSAGKGFWYQISNLKNQAFTNKRQMQKQCKVEKDSSPFSNRSQRLLAYPFSKMQQ